MVRETIKRREKEARTQFLSKTTHGPSTTTTIQIPPSIPKSSSTSDNGTLRRLLGAALLGCLGDGEERFGLEERRGGDAHKLAALVLLLDEVELRGLRLDDERSDRRHQRLQSALFVAERWREPKFG